MIHLHVHSEYSPLDGLSPVTKLVQRAKEIGSSALAITDHGVCGAIPDFITACIAEGIKPIPGCEAYMTTDRLNQADFHKEARDVIYNKYGIKAKAFNAFRKAMRNNPGDFEAEARVLLMNYLMTSETPVTYSHSGAVKSGAFATPLGSVEYRETTNGDSITAYGITEEQEMDLFSFSDVQFNDDDNIFAAPAEVEPIDPIEAFRKEFYEYAKHDNFHLVLVAINNQGLEDLYAIISDAHINGFYSHPRTDLRFIRDHGLGRNIIATSACLGSYFARFALAGDLDECRLFIQECKDTFHSFYLEKQATQIPDQIRLNAIIDQLAIETNTPKIVTTDVHYANKDDKEIHDVLVAAGTGKCISDKDRMIYAHEFWMKSEDEIRELINDDEAIRNTYEIASLVDVTLPSKPLFPKFILEDGDSAEQQLEKTAWNALFQHALRENIDLEVYSTQLKYELSVINELGFADYFLIVADYINWAKDNGYLVGPGRGSAAGSLVAYEIGITELDPIVWNLMFERFLNPERAGYPDIDVDFSYEGARAVQEYLKSKYGADRVAQIGTYGTLAARASIRLVGKTLGYSLTEQDKFAKSIPERPGITLTSYVDKNGKEVSGAYQESTDVRKYAQQYPDWWKTALELEGHVRSEGVHAGGIVLSPEPLTKTVPLRLDKEDLVTTQYDMSWIEKFLVKFDILKLDTLDLIKKTKENAGIQSMDLRYIDYNDPKIYEDVYNTLNLSGIFQCESDLFRGIIKEMKPSSVQDISVIVALGRPGPMDLIPTYIRRKWGYERPTYPFMELQEILEETYGVWVYQEQIMKASIILGGFTKGQSDILRKAISKKQHALMEEWIGYMIYGSEEKGIPGALSRGFTEAILLQIKADWMKFGDYCFNFAHSACYAVLSVQTAWLKAYYPTEFMAALLTISEGKKDKDKNAKNIAYMKECEEMGIRILPPDINQSNDSWTPVAHENPEQKGMGYILYGLASVGGVSDKDLALIKTVRPITDFDDFLVKNLTMKLNKTKVQSLVKSGSFDRIYPNRNFLLREYFKFRGDPYDEIPTKTTKRDVINYERQYLGTNVSVRSRWDGIEDGKDNLTFSGIIMEVNPFNAKSNGKQHCKAKLDAAEDLLNLMIFNKLWMNHTADFMPGRKVRLIGKRSKDDFLVDKITYLEDAPSIDWDVELEGA